MVWFRNLGLSIKITIVVTLVVLCFFALSIFVSYRQQKEFIVAEAVEKARIIAAEAIQAREYISDQLAIGNVDLSVERYGLIPVVSSTRIGELVATDLGYRIRQVSNRYRNPKNAPDAFETRALDKFFSEPSRKEEYEITVLQGERVFRYLQPFRAEESCLECHGDPAVAPGYIKELFPEKTDRAYNYKIGEIIGAASVTIPMDELYRQVYSNLRNELLYSGGIFLALLTCLGLLTRITITAPLARLGEGIGKIVRTGRFEEKIPRRGRDEIGVLIDGFNEMMDQLQENNRNLEDSEKRFRVMTETARDGIITFLGDGKIILFNRQSERLFGYSKREALGMGVDRLVHESCIELHSDGVELYLKEHSGSLTGSLHKIPGRRRDGGRFTLELSLSVAESDGYLMYTAIVREHERGEINSEF